MYQGIKKLFTECKGNAQEGGNLTGVLTGFQSIREKFQKGPRYKKNVKDLTESKCDG